MVKRTPWLVVVVAFLCLTFSGCASRALVSPSFRVATSDNEKVHAAIKAALLRRNWAITKNEPSAIEAEYSRGPDTKAVVRIEHTADNVVIKYVDSSGLRYKPYSTIVKGPSIRRTYNNWVLNLERDIKVAVGAAL